MNPTPKHLSTFIASHSCGFAWLPSKVKTSIILLLLLSISFIASSQAVNKIYGNKIYFTAKGDSTEVFFDIPSKTTPGVLLNVGGGKVAFVPISAIADTGSAANKMDTAIALNDSTTRYCKGATCWDIT